MKRLLSFSLPIVAAAALLMHGGPSASAHASFVSSNPTDKQVLPTAPSAVTMSFAENLVPTPGSFIYVANADGSAGAGDTTVSDTDTKTMTLQLNPGLPDGKYFVFWKSTSADDGGVTFGRFTFFVGKPDPADVASTPPGASVEVPDDATDNALTNTGSPGGGDMPGGDDNSGDAMPGGAMPQGH